MKTKGEHASLDSTDVAAEAADSLACLQKPSSSLCSEARGGSLCPTCWDPSLSCCPLGTLCPCTPPPPQLRAVPNAPPGPLPARPLPRGAPWSPVWTMCSLLLHSTGVWSLAETGHSRAAPRGGACDRGEPRAWPCMGKGPDEQQSAPPVHGAGGVPHPPAEVWTQRGEQGASGNTCGLGADCRWP